MNNLQRFLRDPETWIYLIAVGLGLVIFFTPVLRVCGGFFTLFGLIALGIKFYKLSNYPG
jgi:hypothetical protein